MPGSTPTTCSTRTGKRSSLARAGTCSTGPTWPAASRLRASFGWTLLEGGGRRRLTRRLLNTAESRRGYRKVGESLPAPRASGHWGLNDLTNPPLKELPSVPETDPFADRRFRAFRRRIVGRACRIEPLRRSGLANDGLANDTVEEEEDREEASEQDRARQAREGQPEQRLLQVPEEACPESVECPDRRRGDGKSGQRGLREAHG